METSEGVRLSQSIREKAAEFKKLCAGLDEGHRVPRP